MQPLPFVIERLDFHDALAVTLQAVNLVFLGFDRSVGQDHHIGPSSMCSRSCKRASNMALRSADKPWWSSPWSWHRVAMVVVTVIAVTMAVVVRRVQLRLDLFNLREQRAALVGQFRFEGLDLAFDFLQGHRQRHRQSQCPSGFVGVMRL